MADLKTQYDGIMDNYNQLIDSPSARIEIEVVMSLLSKRVSGRRVLELACGPGVYSFLLMQAGASCVTAVDVSPDAINSAETKRQQLPAADQRSKIKFLVDDCSKCHTIDGGNYDVVFAAWLLEYAANRDGIADMLRTVRVNMKPGNGLESSSVFLCVVQTPTNDPLQQTLDELRVRPPRTLSAGVFVESWDQVTEGLLLHAVNYTPDAADARVQFYYLTKDVYEAAARDAGFCKDITWIRGSVPNHYLSGQRSLEGATLAQIMSYQEVPVFGIMLLQY